MNVALALLPYNLVLLLKNVADAMTNIYSDDNTYERQLHARKMAALALKITQEQYQLRGVNYLDVLVAQQQYQKTVVNVIQAEAEVPKAIAEAFREGNLGIMDYYKYKNIMADTQMRESIAEIPEGPAKTGGEDPKDDE